MRTVRKEKRPDVARIPRQTDVRRQSELERRTAVLLLQDAFGTNSEPKVDQLLQHLRSQSVFSRPAQIDTAFSSRLQTLTGTGE